MKIGKYIIRPMAPVTNIMNILAMKTYRIPFVVNTSKFIAIPQPSVYYIVSQDGIGGEWYAHDNSFTNVIEDDRICFASSPQAALMDYLHIYGKEAKS